MATTLEAITMNPKELIKAYWKADTDMQAAKTPAQRQYHFSDKQTIVRRLEALSTAGCAFPQCYGTCCTEHESITLDGSMPAPQLLPKRIVPFQPRT